MKFTRITVDAHQMGGLGMTHAEILNAYPDLQAEDIHEALRYAAEAVRERRLPLIAK